MDESTLRSFVSSIRREPALPPIDRPEWAAELDDWERLYRELDR